ncbi:MAG: hypothetical protein QW115_01965 [Thermoplasmata archaeon]
MQIWKKALVVLVLAATVMGLAATQYAKLGVSVSANISTPTSLIQLMAGDGAVVGGGYILTNDNGAYKVQLGTFAKGFNKTYTAAFAIVNAEANVNLRITKISVNGDLKNNVVIALHKTADKNALVETDDGIVYYDFNVHSSTGIGYDHSSDGFVLAKGAGTYDTGSNKLKYGTDPTNWPPSWYTASWDGTHNVWLTDGSHNDATYLTTDINSKANFVWVQITLDLSTATDGTSLTGTLYIEVQSA